MSGVETRLENSDEHTCPLDPCSSIAYLFRIDSNLLIYVVYCICVVDGKEREKCFFFTMDSPLYQRGRLPNRAVEWRSRNGSIVDKPSSQA